MKASLIFHACGLQVSGEDVERELSHQVLHECKDINLIGPMLYDIVIIYIYLFATMYPIEDIYNFQIVCRTTPMPQALGILQLHVCGIKIM